MACCEDPACSRALLAAATQEATHLSDQERQMILGVLGRDEQLRRDQQHRVVHLKAELQNLRRKGALRPSADWDSTGSDPDRACGRCRVELGRVINRGAYCRACRLKVCKGCREYSLRTTDWVCTVCYKHMEIQAASGEWMNEFVRRPSRRRDNRVYVPAADIIKRTIRRSWTISNPTPRWSALRGSPELRPYNSLPRGQDIASYPSLAPRALPAAPHAPCRRTVSEDVYAPAEEPRAARVNPLVRFADKGAAKARRRPPREPEKRVSFDGGAAEAGGEAASECESARQPDVRFAKEEVQPVELCDIEPLSGTVFRKVTVRRRRQDMRKIPAVDTGWRRGDTTDLLDILLPAGDDYKLVFISSDSSSKEEDVDDTDSASSCPIDDCDWDYFEPSAARPECGHRAAPPAQPPCSSCGAPAQFIPIPVPVPIPFPVLWPAMAPPQESSDESDSEGGARGVYRVYNVSGECDETSAEEEAASGSGSATASSDSDSDSERCSRTFVVNGSASEAEEEEEEEGATDEEGECTVVLTNVRQLDDEVEKAGSASRCLADVNSSEEGGSGAERAGGEEGGSAVAGEPDVGATRNAARYTSLVMITQEPAPYQQVSIVTTNTTTLVAENDVVVRHTNWEDGSEVDEGPPADNQSHSDGDSVHVITGGETLSAFEEGLADDDSWVERLSHDDDEDDDDSLSVSSSTSGEEVTLTCSAALDHEDELRGYHRAAIDFTLHTIVEESCEESEPEAAARSRTTNLENYFFFRLGDGVAEPLSETSSLCSEALDSLGEETQEADTAELASSRLEKYFLHGFMGFESRRDSDGSVGSDSEGRPSPEQRRKRLVRARGTGRSHSSSLDNLLTNPDLSEPAEAAGSEGASSSDSDTYDELNTFEKGDGQFDTVKRKKLKKSKVSNEDAKTLETTQEVNEDSASDEDEDGHRTPQPEPSNLTTNKNQQSRDSGFIGSCDDLLKEQRENVTPEVPVLKSELENIVDEKKQPYSTPPATLLTRKDSFNNWSSDEETNLMMCKMRQFFKTMVANTSKSGATPLLSSPKPVPSPRMRNRCKPPQLVYFENELTRLMKTVPGIRDDQVREIVEYLSSEDTWSDSYDSSDYTSSDLEITTASKSVIQQQISDSCKQIISKFDNGIDNEGDEGDGGIIDETSHGLNRETAFVYQKLVASFEKIATGDGGEPTPSNSPPLIAKVMHHIGSRLVALMHEVSSGESHASNSPKTRHYHRRLVQKLSSASTTDDDSTSDSNLPDRLPELEETLSAYSLLPRSRSHDLLMSEPRHHQSSSGVSDIAEERGEASDCERFSWRGSFESALLAADSRNRLSLIGGEGTAAAVAAKRRSAGDLLFKSLSREQLDRVRSCGSIGGAGSEDRLWTRPTRRRSSVPDAACGSGGSADGEEEEEEGEEAGGGKRATLPRSLQSAAASTNSLPRLPTGAPPVAAASMQKAQSMSQFLPPSAKSARYRPPGFNRPITTVTKRAVSAPGLQPTQQRRGRRSQQHNVPSDDTSISEAHSSPMLVSRNGNKSATPSPVAPGARRCGTGSMSSADWSHTDEDIDKFVIHHPRSGLSSLGFRSDSMASVYSGAGEGRYGTVTVRGQVEFGLQYNYKSKALEILVRQCRDLAPVDAKRNRSDPYVKVYLLPDKSKSGKRKTKVKKHTLNPVFDETLKFHISLSGLETRTLWLTVWHSDMFGRNDFLGEVMMTLENKVFDDPTPKWYNLQERTEPFDDMLSFKGDIIVCLKFVPPDMTVQKKGKRSRGTLHVLVKEAKSLTAVKANGTSDPFCKSYLLPEKGRSSKQKTSVAKRTVNPVWNYTFVYEDVTLQELAERCLELTVWDHDRLASNEFLGGVRFSLGAGKHHGKPVDWMDATGKELSLWKNMLERPNFWVEGCLSLRPSLDTRAS